MTDPDPAQRLEKAAERARKAAEQGKESATPPADSTTEDSSGESAHDGIDSDPDDEPTIPGPA